MSITQNDIFNSDGSFFSDDSGMPKTSSGEGKALSVLSPTESEIYDSLSAKQKDEVSKFISGIDLSTEDAISNYGLATRQNISSLNKHVLSTTKTKDLGEVGTTMSNLMKELKGISIPAAQSRGIFGRVRSSIEVMRSQLTPIQKNVDTAVTIMQKHQSTLRADNKTYEELYNANLAYYRDLCMYIIAGKLKLEEENAKLAQLHAKATETGDMADVEKYNAMTNRITQFEQLLNDLESAKILCIQNAPTIRIAQTNNATLIQKFDFIFHTAVPAWENQISIALNLENAKQAAQAANSAIDFTNELIRKNADMLNQGTKEVAKLAEREIISSDTLEYANQRLIDGLKEVMAIHEAGKVQRNESHARKAALEEDMKKELLALSTKNPT